MHGLEMYEIVKQGLKRAKEDRDTTFIGKTQNEKKNLN